MTAPIDEWDLDALPVRGRSESVFEPSLPTRGRSATVTSGTGLADQAKQRLGVIFLFSTMYANGQDIPYAAVTRGRSGAVDLSLQTKTQALKGKVLEYLQRAADFVKAKIRAALDYFDNDIETKIGDLIVKAGDFLAKQLSEAYKTMAPIVGSAMDSLGGLDKAFTNAKALFDTWITSKSAKVAEGHPAVIVDSLRAAMKASLFEGLYETAKGAVGIAGEVATLGAAKIAMIVLKVVEGLIKAIWRAVEGSKITKFFAEAENHWINRTAADAIHLDQRKFVEWYKPYAMSVPAIAAMALISGICGDKMAYLQMYQKDLSVVTADQFRRGAESLDAMKPWAKKYLKDSGIELASNNAMISKLLAVAETKQTEMLSQVMAAVS
jgi:hypothetical protein